MKIGILSDIHGNHISIPIIMNTMNCFAILLGYFPHEWISEAAQKKIDAMEL